MVVIPANSYIEMEEDAAHDFKYAFFPPYVDGGGTQLKSSYKKIRIVKPKVQEAKKESKLLCNACNYEAPTDQALEDHLMARHLDQLTDPKAADEIKKKAKHPHKAS